MQECQDRFLRYTLHRSQFREKVDYNDAFLSIFTVDCYAYQDVDTARSMAMAYAAMFIIQCVILIEKRSSMTMQIKTLYHYVRCSYVYCVTFSSDKLIAEDKVQFFCKYNNELQCQPILYRRHGHGHSSLNGSGSDALPVTDPINITCFQQRENNFVQNQNQGQGGHEPKFHAKLFEICKRRPTHNQSCLFCLATFQKQLTKQCYVKYIA